MNFYNYFRYHETVDKAATAHVYFVRKETALDCKENEEFQTAHQRGLLCEKFNWQAE